MQRKLITTFAAACVLVIGLFATGTASAKNTSCTTIRSGTLVDTAGNPISLGYDQYGYNYQAHMFNGYYGNFSRPGTPVTSGPKLIMKWSQAWLANVSCDGNNTLDRGLGTSSPGTSEGWLTNEYIEKYVGSDGKTHTYTEFDKIVYVGPGGDLWGDYTVIQTVINDPYGGLHGVQFKPQAPGFGLNDGWTS